MQYITSGTKAFIICGGALVVRRGGEHSVSKQGPLGVFVFGTSLGAFVIHFIVCSACFPFGLVRFLLTSPLRVCSFQDCLGEFLVECSLFIAGHSNFWVYPFQEFGVFVVVFGTIYIHECVLCSFP